MDDTGKGLNDTLNNTQTPVESHDSPETYSSPPPYFSTLTSVTVIFFFTAAIGILYLVATYYWEQGHTRKIPPQPHMTTAQTYTVSDVETPNLPTAQNPLPDEVATPIISTPLTVQFDTPKPLGIKLDLESENPQSKEGFFMDIYDVGEITSPGPYQGYRLINFLYVANVYQGKGPASYVPQVNYALMKGNSLVYLAQMNLFWSDKLNSAIEPIPFISPSEYSIRIDRNSVVSQLLLPQEIIGTNSRQTLTLMRRVKGTRNDALVERITSMASIGDIYTTRQPQSISQTSLPDSFLEPESQPRKWILPEKCEADDCQRMNGFYVFLPDGTFGIYRYTPDLAIVGQADYPSTNVTYQSITRYGCSADQSIDLNNRATQIYTSEQLTAVFTDTHTQEPLYRLKNVNDPQLMEFYKRYKTSAEYTKQYQPNHETVSYEAFVSQNPILFWTDPWGRQLRLINNEFLVPNFCEPIIYLYPPHPQPVTIRLQHPVSVSYSEPAYGNAWHVTAHPDGTIFDLSGKKYPYLFWEGSSGIFSLPQAGTVVEHQHVEQFLDESLSRLGLNATEMRDFKAAWLEELRASPYVQIYFWDQHEVDMMAPISITPVPDTMIRVLMDYRPLSAPIQLAPQVWPTVPEREGFVLVEWGGVRR